MRETEGLIKQGMDSTPEQAYQGMAQGTDTSGLLNQSDNTNQNLSFGDQALSSAIRGKYSKPFQVQQQGLQNKMKLDARNEHFEKIRVAHELANEEANLNFQKELIKYKQKQQKRAQRQAVIGSVLGLVGGIAGGVFTGGNPAGVGAGMAAGQGAGNAASAVSNEQGG